METQEAANNSQLVIHIVQIPLPPMLKLVQGYSIGAKCITLSHVESLIMLSLLLSGHAEEFFRACYLFFFVKGGVDRWYILRLERRGFGAHDYSLFRMACDSSHRMLMMAELLRWTR